MAERMNAQRIDSDGQGAASREQARELQAASAPPQGAAGGVEQPGQESPEKAGKAGDQLKEKARGVGGRLKGRASEAAESRKSGVAGRIDRVSDRLGERARTMQTEGGLKGKAGHAVHRAGEALEDSADYLRTHEIGSIRDDVQTRIQGHPFLTVGLALGTGFMLGRALGGGEEDESCELLEQEPEALEEPGMMDRLKAQARGPLGRAAMSGMSAVVANQVRNRVSGRHN